MYRFTQFIAWFIAFFVFGRKVVRNEIRHAERPFVLIANHECALDFVNIIGLNFPAIAFGFPMMLLAAIAPKQPLLTWFYMIAFFTLMNLILFRRKIFRKKVKK